MYVENRLIFVNVCVCVLELLMAASKLSSVQLDKRQLIYMYI